VSEERLVLTGATGVVGRQLVRLLLDRHPDVRLVFLLRESAGRRAIDRADGLVAACADPDSARRRVEVVAADVAAPRCGLSERDWHHLADGATRVIHGAAAVRFDTSIEQARAINVGGARNVIAVAVEAQRRGTLRSFSYISTAFVAGLRHGSVREDELDAGQRFRNAYEQSKFESESLVRAEAGRLPAIILRPSIIVGDSRTGVTTSFNTMYWPLRAYAQGRWRLVPGRSDAVIDIVPVEFVAHAIAHLALDENSVGRCFHLCAGPARSATLGEIGLAAARFFSAAPPRYVNPEVFAALLRPILFVVLWGRWRRILKLGRVYRPYFDLRMVFDTSQADAALAPAGIRPPHVMDYLDRLFTFCVESNWGRSTAGGGR
jgi:thioester reductase-like protein